MAGYDREHFILDELSPEPGLFDSFHLSDETLQTSDSLRLLCGAPETRFRETQGLSFFDPTVPGKQ